MYNLILYFKFDYFNKTYISIIYKMIEILENRNILKDETQISCLKVLFIIIKKLKDVKYDLNNMKNILLDIRNSAGNYIDNRIKGVRKVARDCVKLLNLIESEESNKGLDNDIINHKNMFQKLRNFSKKEKYHKYGQYDNMIVDNLHNDIYKKTMGNLLNLSNFIQKHTKSNTKEKINNNKASFLKSKNVERFDFYNKMPINENFSFSGGDGEENNNNIYNIYNEKEIDNNNDNNNNILLLDNNIQNRNVQKNDNIFLLNKNNQNKFKNEEQKNLFVTDNGFVTPSNVAMTVKVEMK